MFDLLSSGFPVIFSHWSTCLRIDLSVIRVVFSHERDKTMIDDFYQVERRNQFSDNHFRVILQLEWQIGANAASSIVAAFPYIIGKETALFRYWFENTIYHIWHSWPHGTNNNNISYIRYGFLYFKSYLGRFFLKKTIFTRKE